MKELTLCEKVDLRVGITAQSWSINDVTPHDFICKYVMADYTDSGEEYPLCLYDGLRCPVFDLIIDKMRRRRDAGS